MAELETALVEWLKVHGPEDWHKVASHYNWDHGIKPLWWMVQQDACYKATALQVFWNAEPDFYLSPDNQSDETYEYMTDLRPMLDEISRNWSSERYKDSRYGFGDNAIYEFEEFKALSDSFGDRPAPFVVPASMFDPLEGEEMAEDYENYPEGIPRELSYLLD